MTVSTAKKITASKRITAVFEAQDLTTVGGINAAITVLRWAAAAEVWDVIKPYASELAAGIALFNQGAALAAIPPHAVVDIYNALRTLNYKDMLNNTGEGSRLADDQTIREYLRLNDITGEVTSQEDPLPAFIRSIFDHQLLYTFFLLNVNALDYPGVPEHLEQVAAFNNFPETITKAVTDGVDEEQDEFVIRFGGNVPYFYARYLEYKALYEDYIQAGTPTTPVDSSDYGRIAIQNLDNTLQLIY